MGSPCVWTGGLPVAAPLVLTPQSPRGAATALHVAAIAASAAAALALGVWRPLSRWGRTLRLSRSILSAALASAQLKETGNRDV